MKTPPTLNKYVKWFASFHLSSLYDDDDDDDDDDDADGGGGDGDGDGDGDDGDDDDDDLRRCAYMCAYTVRICARARMCIELCIYNCFSDTKNVPD